MEASVKQIIKAFGEILTSVTCNRGEVIHQSNARCNKIFIVQSGVLRSYYFREGKDITAHFAMDYSIIGAVDSLLRQTTSIYSIEALEKSKILVMEYSEMELFLDKNPRLERLARQVSQWLYLDLVERLEGMMFLSAEERYSHLLNRYPNITQKVNLGYIASYLGITQETLSRIRKSR
ncbi:MAG: Crp/Fnr family transcriptional regulator [Phaeodactylibacter sp.]|uniref:Crp/Fnr family transcriptional regulator n=1 Tax=Phaeodactylibacter sp. TaxID=1940289 RepID=UPI0032EC0F2D